MSTHKICFHKEIRKIYFFLLMQCPLSSGVVHDTACMFSLIMPLELAYIPQLLFLCTVSFTVNVLKFRTLKCLIKWHMQTVQTQIRLLLWSSLIRVYTVCHSTKRFKRQLRKTAKFKQKKNKTLNKVFDILGHLPYTSSLLALPLIFFIFFYRGVYR